MRKQIATFLILGITFLSSGLIQAKEIIYQPPPDRGNRQKTAASGSRGCHIADLPTLTVLTPEDHTAVTISAKPTFFLHLSKVSSQPIWVTVTEPGVAKSIFSKELKPQTPGIFSVSLENDSELRPNTTYIFAVGILCNPERLSDSIYTRIAFKRIAPTPELKQQLFLAATSTEKAQILAVNGIWYDALTASYEEKEDSTLFRSLLKQVGLEDKIQNLYNLE